MNPPDTKMIELFGFDATASGQEVFYGAGQGAQHVIKVADEQLVMIELIGARTSVITQLDVPLDAVVADARAIVRARPPGWTPVDLVAEVRADGTHVVIDFGRMRTVSGASVGGDADVEAFAWMGTTWGALPLEMTDATFPEVQTERLRIGPGLSAATVRNSGQVHVSSASADLELLVADKRVWFHPGEAKKAALGTTATAGDHFVAAVDLTEAVAAAGGAVAVELRAATAGFLSLATAMQLQRVHRVGFPEGPERAVTFENEGAATLVLPINVSPGEPARAAWRVTGASFQVAAKLASTRVIWPTRPVVSDDAELVLDADHAVAIELRPEQTGLFHKLTGVRAMAYVEDGGAELAGVFLLDADGEPGEPLPGGALSPVVLSPAPRADNQVAWAALATSRPISVPAGRLWLALQASRGSITLPLAQAGGGEVRRGMAGGPWRAFASATRIIPRAEVRLVGEAPEAAPIPALAIALANSSAKTIVTPSSGGTLVAVTLPPGTSPFAIDGDLELELTATAPGAYRFSDVRVFYGLDSDAT